MILFLVVFCVLVALGFGIASGLSDFKTMTIPNIYCVGIAAAFAVAFLADMLTGTGMEFFAAWKPHLLAGAMIFGATFVLFGLGLIGAGDSKLCTAFALWVGLTGLASFLFWMAMTGAVLGILTKIMNKKILVQSPAEGSWIAKAQDGARNVPYGIAIVTGAVIAFYQLGYFSPEKLTLLAGGGDFTEIQP